MSIEFRELADALDCKTFAEAEGMKLVGGRARCPFHPGASHFNLAFKESGRCHCYRCGRTADVIQLASAVWKTSQVDAASRLNQMFSLGLDRKKLTPEDLAHIRQRQTQRDLVRQSAEAALEEAQAEAAAAWAKVAACDTTSPDYAEILRRARNADVWKSFKLMELQQMSAPGRG